MRIYGDSISGNCLKVKWTCDFIGHSYEWIETSVVAGDTRKPAFLEINPVGQVPAIVFDDGHRLAQSNAIILYLADGSALIPDDPFARAKMLEWMFWEQYSHEPAIAVARYQVKFEGKPVADLAPRLVERGWAALKGLDDGLVDREFLLGPAVSLADVALVAYTRWAGDGGFDVARYPRLRGWIGRCEQALNVRD